MTVKTIYKLMTAAEWDAAWAEGVYRGSEQDERDGFIHFSTAAQIASPRLAPAGSVSHGAGRRSRAG